MTTKDSKEKERDDVIEEQTQEDKTEPEEEAGEAGAKDVAEEEQSEATESEEDDDSKYLRLMADFQNYKRRVEKEKSDIYSYANEKLAIELLAVIDNFERALDHDGEEGSFKEGMAMIFKQLCDVLEKSGLSEIPALGEDFDPNFHNAVMNEDTEEYESGKVSGVMQKGYTLNGRVIRPSMVRVAS